MIELLNFLHMTKKKLVASLLIIFLLTAVFTVLFYNYTLNISGIVKSTPSESIADSKFNNKPIIYISVISRYPPNIIYRGYQPMLDYLTAKTKYRFELKLSEDYNQAVKMLVEKEVAAAFLGSYVYVAANKNYGVIPILKPLNENFEPFSRSVLFTSSKSDIYSINDLIGKRISLPSKESYSSNWLLRYEFKKHSIKEKDLQTITNFPHHQTVIYNVSKGYYDAGVTREYLVKKITDSSIRVLLYSDPFPTSPIVVAPNYSQEVVSAIQSVLLEINNNNPKRAEITKGWDNEFVYGFVKATDKDYDIIRKISK